MSQLSSHSCRCEVQEGVSCRHEKEVQVPAGRHASDSH